MIDLNGRRFGKLTVIEPARLPSGKMGRRCRCDCGNMVTIQASHLTDGGVDSCGCYTYEKRCTHGDTGTKEYAAWEDMRRRCRKHPTYIRRKITVCDRWQTYEQFLKDVGRAPSEEYTLDRIDNDRGYEPSNCRWTTMRIQCRNRSNTHYCTYQGERLPLITWAERFNISWCFLYGRVVVRGWPIELALKTPKHSRLKYVRKLSIPAIRS